MLLYGRSLVLHALGNAYLLPDVQILRLHICLLFFILFDLNHGVFIVALFIIIEDIMRLD